jgi:hypothetical protein
MALRWIGHEPSDETTAMLRANRARNWAEFQKAFDRFAIPGQRMLYTDCDGHIGQLIAARLLRRHGIPAPDLATEAEGPGDRAATIGSADLPSTFDPPQGFIASANERPSATEAAGTRFGRDHRFTEIRSIADFQAHVPLSRYEEMWHAYWQGSFPQLVDCSWPGTIPFFALTSGTTSGKTKYIPCSYDMNWSNDWAAIDILVHHLANRPQSRVLGGKNLMLGGSTALSEIAPGIRSGDLSGIAAGQIPWWARPYCFPPPGLALMADWEEKIEKIARAALGEDIRSVAGTPSWLRIFFDRLFNLTGGIPRRLARIFPTSSCSFTAVSALRHTAMSLRSFSTKAMPSFARSIPRAKASSRSPIAAPAKG